MRIRYVAITRAPHRRAALWRDCRRVVQIPKLTGNAHSSDAKLLDGRIHLSPPQTVKTGTLIKLPIAARWHEQQRPLDRAGAPLAPTAS